MTFHFKQAVKQLALRVSTSKPAFFANRYALQKPQLEQICTSVCRNLGDVSPREPKPSEIPEIYDYLIEYHNNHHHFKDIPKRYIRMVPWLLFNNVDKQRPALLENKKIGSAFFKFIHSSPDARTVLNLAIVFLRSYPKERPYFNKICQLIKTLLSKGNSSRCLNFAKKAEKYGLFNPDGPQNVADELYRDKSNIDEILSNAGLYGACRLEGFIEEVFDLWITMISADLSTKAYRDYKDRLSNILQFSTDRRILKFPQKKKNLIEGLLLPFHQSKPEEECKQTILEFLTKQFGDPRLEIGEWIGIDNSAISVIRGWLSELVLEDFFRLLDYSAKADHDADRQWKYRRAFWGACLHHRLIDDAWFALGKKVADNAHFFLQKRKNPYAVISGPGVQGHHAVLILRIRNMIATEWTHSGKYRFWFENAKHAPKLYKNDYRREDVISYPIFEGAHHGAPNGRWQQNVANYIRQQVGYNLPYSDYMRI